MREVRTVVVDVSEEGSGGGVTVLGRYLVAFNRSLYIGGLIVSRGRGVLLRDLAGVPGPADVGLSYGVAFGGLLHSLLPSGALVKPAFVGFLRLDG